MNGPVEQALQLINSGQADAGLQQLRQVASGGDPEALFVLADLTWSGTLVPQDPARGRLLFEYAGALGHPQANLIATNLLANGVAGKRDWAAALQRLEAEAQRLPERRAALELLRAMSLDADGGPTAVPAANRLSDRPDARLLEQAVTAAECAYLIAIAEPLFRPSMVYDKLGRGVRDTIRTSDGAALHWGMEDPAIHAINRRIAGITATEYDQGEALQVLRYSPGQEYRPHFDYLEGVENPRPWTALIYLNDDYEGGATEFVQTGLQVRGKAGDVLVFRNALDDGSKDPLAQHAGVPVTAGVKYLATRWIRERRWTP